MTKPVRIQRKRTKGFNLQASSPNGLPVVYVGRPTKWGNPFSADEYGRMGAVIMFAEYALNHMPQSYLDELRGKNLACWCSLALPNWGKKDCHADVLLELANKEDGNG
jgi:hypothetical protein